MSASSDDAFESPGGWPGYSHTIKKVYSGAPGGGGPTWGGWRWTGLGIPEGATITEAYVEFNQVRWGGYVRTTLAFEDSAHPAAFYHWSTPYDRWVGRTTFEVEQMWGRRQEGIWVRSSSLVEGLQELVDSHGAIDKVVLLENGTGTRGGYYVQWASYDRDPSLAATLYIEYDR